MNISPSISKRIVDDERGAVLVLVTLLMVVLFGFAGLAVDLGAAWAEKRQDQSAADAAAMAAAIEYVRGAPTDDDIIDIVKDFVEQNIGYPTDGPGWATCPAPTDDFIPLSGTNCVSLKQTQTLANDVLVKVRVPTQEVPTSFARLIGIHSISVSAEAIARIEANPGALGALPFALPTGLSDGQEYCLGTPPAGVARDLCSGASTGFFGTVNSPFFGAAADPWGTVGCADSPTNTNERIRWNTALGLDHFIRIAPEGANPDDGEDDCAASTATPVEIPYALFADNGSLTQVSAGFIGGPQFGTLNLPGRLRQGVGVKRDLLDGAPTILADNAGLWEFLIHPTGPGSATDTCRSELFEPLVVGTELTANLIECLKSGTVKFNDDLLSSPRFALAPVIDLVEADIGNISPSKATNIVEFAPIYLQASWYNCSANQCAEFITADGWVDGEGSPPEVFEPGEGTEEGCFPQAGGCKNISVNQAQIEGITAILLTNEDWLPDSFDNQFNDPGGFNVYLFR
ncbi:MAG TPA: pilus assembly protein TadG-related protein [Acidimicrobiia bacterium]|nr:pilus assembly protein TadG-related protein [Acidimicrobiia bacterium]